MDPTGTGIGALITTVLAGGSTAVIALLLFIILSAVFVIKYLLGQLKNRDDQLNTANERYLKLIETNHNSNSMVTGALNDVKMVLVEIKSKL